MTKITFMKDKKKLFGRRNRQKINDARDEDTLNDNRFPYTQTYHFKE